MKIIGLTGGIASGKSTAAAILERFGAKVIDADQLAREAVEPGTPALEAIVSLFGRDVVAADGSLNREALGARVFADARARKRLEEVTHPAIRKLAQQRLDEFRAAGIPVVIYMAPLLFEAGAEALVDEVWVVDVDQETQETRLSGRDGRRGEAARQRIAAQMPPAEKARRGDVVVDNRGSIAELEAQLRKIWKERVMNG